MASEVPLRIRLHYDFASCVCYVAHRVLQRIAPQLDAVGIELLWTPIDLAKLMGWRRGGKIAPDRLENVARISQELRVPLRSPPCWLDSRRAGAVAIALGDGLGAPAWRERVWSAVFEQGHFEALSRIGQAAASGCASDAGWLGDLALDTRAIDEAAVEAGLVELEQRTRDAREEMVSGVPTFMLDSWPFGGIQEDDTMVSILTRYVKRKRLRGLQHSDDSNRSDHSDHSDQADRELS